MPNSGQEYADEQALIKMYKELWGFSDAEAKEEAATVVARGPSSPIYKARMESAWQHLQQVDPNNKLFETAKAPFPESAPWDSKATAAQAALNERRQKLATPPSATPPSTSPNVDLHTMYKFYNQGMNLEPKVAMHLAAEDYKRGLQSKAMDAVAVQPQAPTPQPTLSSTAPSSMIPVPPAPVPPTPAAPTPQHLDDANFSSWQQYAQFLGYPIRRR
jgi:hypothetical protein